MILKNQENDLLQKNYLQLYNSKLTDLYNRKKQSTRCCKIIINNNVPEVE